MPNSKVDINTQLEHHNTFNHKLSAKIVVVSDNLRTPENVGMLIRTCEAFGVKRIHICGKSPNLNNKKVVRTSRSAHRELKLCFNENIINVFKNLKSENFTVFALELSSQSIPIQQVNFKTHRKIAIIIGAEREGIQKAILENADQTVYIPMYGKNSSINVINALSASLHEITRHFSL